jgi:hypothetical protein
MRHRAPLDTAHHSPPKRVTGSSKCRVDESQPAPGARSTPIPNVGCGGPRSGNPVESTHLVENRQFDTSCRLVYRNACRFGELEYCFGGEGCGMRPVACLCGLWLNAWCCGCYWIESWVFAGTLSLRFSVLGCVFWFVAVWPLKYYGASRNLDWEVDSIVLWSMKG